METITLVKAHERVDMLDPYGLKTIQNPEWFKYGTDSVLLASFAQVKRKNKVLDLGTGSGVLALLLWGRYRPSHITGIEIQPGVADMARRSVALNGLEQVITILEGDYLDYKHIPDVGRYDVVIANPPYMQAGSGEHSTDEPNRIARHEVTMTLEGMLNTVSHALNSGGKFFMVHVPYRLAEIVATMRAHRLEPKRLRLVQPFIDKAPNLLLVEGAKDGRQGVKWEPTLYMYEKNGSFSQAMQEIYAGNVQDDR